LAEAKGQGVGALLSASMIALSRTANSAMPV
jgi:hypothetical protein